MDSLGHERGRAVGCPRCGYDQRGVMALWREQCPLEGTCSECGLTFSWAEVIVPDKFEPAWCVEFAQPWRRVPMACVKTFVRSFRPWKFWSRMSMSQRIRPRRLALYCAAGVLPLLVCYIAMQTVLALHARLALQRELALQQRSLPGMVLNLQSRLHALERGEPLEADQWRNEEQRSHLIRALRGNIPQLQMLAASPPIINHSLPEALFEAIVFPLRPISSGSIQLGDGTVSPYPDPISLHGPIDWSRGSSWRRSVFRGLFEILFLNLICAVILLFALPASFALLPASRRKAKVRWIHLARITVYSLFILYGLVLTDWAGLLTLGLVRSTAAAELFAFAAHYGSMLVWIALPLWWWAAISRYLKMPHAGAIAWIMTFMIALMLSPLLLAVLPEKVVDFILDW